MTIRLDTRGNVGDLVTRRAGDWGVVAPELSVRAETKPDGSGGFEGFLVVFGVRDTYGTTFQRGCFTEGGLDPSAYPYLAMHSPMLPLGTFTAEEREEGLWIGGEYDPTPEGQAWRARAVSGSAPELSVGFVWLADGGEDDPDLITSARLVEGSQIVLRMASVPGATIAGVRGQEATLEDPAAAVLRAARVSKAHAMLALRLSDLGG